MRIIDCEVPSLVGLSKNRCLELRRCTGIKDIHSLAKVKVITIDDCEGISDYDALLNVP